MAEEIEDPDFEGHEIFYSHPLSGGVVAWCPCGFSIKRGSLTTARESGDRHMEACGEKAT